MDLGKSFSPLVILLCVCLFIRDIHQQFIGCQDAGQQHGKAPDNREARKFG
jgi:hypothetical protein